MADDPQVMEQMSAGGPNVGQPASGTYGEGADLERLKKSLPVGNMGNPGGGAGTAGMPPVSPQPPLSQPKPMGRPNTSAAVPQGLPGVLAAPTQQPQTPVNTPLAPAQAQPSSPTPTGDQTQDRINILMTLVNHPGVSADTKAWAQAVLHVLMGH